MTDLIPGLHGGDGIFLATKPAASHTAHFGISSAASINRLNEQIGSEIGAFSDDVVMPSLAGITFAPHLNLGYELDTGRHDQSSLEFVF